MPYLIGLTGGIASGKNAVADMLVARGAGLVDADQVSRQLVEPGSSMLAELAAAFGADIVAADGRLDRKALAARVFGQPEQVARLNALTHPAILAEMRRRAEHDGRQIVVFMAPLLFEAGGQDLVDEVWVVRADEEERIRRILARDRIAESEARARIAAQIAPRESARRADVIIENNGDLAATEAQVEAAWRALRERVAH
jgi:dephospho-CoA kinase